MSDFFTLKHSCSNCLLNFSSRNKLFKHISNCSSISLPTIDKDVDLGNTDLTEDGDYKVFIFVTGGRIRGKTLGSVEYYDIESRNWVLSHTMLDNRGSHSAVSVEGNLYVIGGGGFYSNLCNCEVYDVIRGTWIRISPMRSCRHALGVVAVSRKIYAIGGWENGNRCCNTVEVYDTSANTWEFSAPLPTARRLLGVTSFNQKIYVFGGNCDDPIWTSAHAEVYDIDTNTWTSLAPMPLEGGAGAATVGKFIFIFIHGKSVLKYNPLTDSYSKLSTLPLPEWFCFDVITVGSVIYVVGGATVGKWTQACYCYDPRLDTWSELPSMLKPRRRCAAAVVRVPKSI